MDEKQINTRYPICLSECPSTWEAEIQCYIGNNTFDALPSYKTHAVDGVCEPIAGTAGNLIYREIFLFYFLHRPNHFVQVLVRHAYPILLGTAACTLAAAVLYVMFVAHFVKEIIWTGLFSIVLLPLGVGLHMFQCHRSGSCGYVVPEGPAGWVLVTLSVVLLFGICQASTEIEKAIVCMRWSCHCVTKVQSLKISPLLRTVGECAVIVSHVLVMSCLNSIDLLADKSQSHIFLGMTGCKILVGLMMIWHLGIVHQINNMAMIYAAQSWFFQGGMSAHKATAPSIGYGYWIALRYHLGTCMFAGLVILLVAPIRIPLKLLTGLMHSGRNPVGLLLWVCFGWIEDCFYNNLEGLCSHSIYDTVLQSNSWCDAVKHSTAVIYEEGAVGHVLKEATWIFELAGIGIFAFSSYALSQLVIKEVAFFKDPESEGFIALPYTASCTCLFISIMFSYPFMDLFRLVSDCILYSRTVEKQRLRVPGQDDDGDALLPGGCTDEFASTVQMLLCMDGRRA